MFFTRRLPRAAVGALAVAAAALPLAGCTGPADERPDRPSGPLQVVAGFYAVDYLATRIGGNRVVVRSLTRPGAEPHDTELTARDVVRIAKSDLAVHLSGFQPAVDAGIEAAQARHVLDVGAAFGLHVASAENGDAGHEEDPPAGGTADPHFWLDPELMARAGGAVERALAAVDPPGAPAYRANLAGLTTDLEAVSRSYRTGLAHCASTDLVTSHAAYGHLARLVGFHQHPLALSPETDPTPAQLAAITDFVRGRGTTTTIYAEPLTSRKVAETVAAETGARLAVLDPIEGINAGSAATDYLGLMRTNLATLEAGQQCP